MNVCKVASRIRLLRLVDSMADSVSLRANVTACILLIFSKIY